MIDKVHTLKVRIRTEKKSEGTDDTELLIDITDIQKKNIRPYSKEYST